MGTMMGQSDLTCWINLAKHRQGGQKMGHLNQECVCVKLRSWGNVGGGAEGASISRPLCGHQFRKAKTNPAK